MFTPSRLARLPSKTISKPFNRTDTTWPCKRTGRISKRCHWQRDNPTFTNKIKIKTILQAQKWSQRTTIRGLNLQTCVFRIKNWRRSNPQLTILTVTLWTTLTRPNSSNHKNRFKKTQIVFSTVSRTLQFSKRRILLNLARHLWSLFRVFWRPGKQGNSKS